MYIHDAQETSGKIWSKTHSHLCRHEKKWPYTLRFPQGRLAPRERHRRSTSCCCGTPQLLDCRWIYLSVGLYQYKFGLRMCADLTTSSYLTASGLLAGGEARGAGNKAPVLLLLSPSAAARVEAWLAGRTAAAAGSCWTCWLSGVMLPTVTCVWHWQEIKTQSWNEVALHPPLSAGPAGQAGAVQEKYLPNVSVCVVDCITLHLGLVCWAAPLAQ